MSVDHVRSALPFPESILTVCQTDLDKTPMTVVEGTIPEDIWGHAFMLSLVGQVDSPPVPNSSNVAPSAGGNPLYNGMGMVCRFDFDSSGVVNIKTKVTKPPSYYADQVTKAGTPGAEYGFRNYGLARLSSWLGVRDALNTGMVPMKFGQTPERILVTCDVGRPYEIDPVTLDIVTPMGGNDEWDEQLPLDLPFPMVTNTAHPVFDQPSQTLFTVNFTKSLATLLSQLLKSDEARLSQLVRKIIAEFIHFLESPFNLENLHLFQDIKELLKIIEADIEEILQLLEEFWHDFYELLQDIIKDQEAFEELKQVLNDGKQMLEGFSKVQDGVYLMCWKGQGKLQRWQLKLADGSPVKIYQTMHQIVVTQDYVVVMDTGFKIGPEQLLSKPVLHNKQLEALLREYLDYPESPESRLYIVNRIDLTPDKTDVTAKPVTIERAAVHLLANYENPQNRITLHIAHTAALDLSEWVRPYDTTEAPPEVNPPIGMTVGPVDVHSLGRYVIDAETGTLDQSASRMIYDEHLTWNASIGVYNDRHTTPQIESLYWNFWGGWSDLLTDFIQNLYAKYPRLIPLETVLELTKQGVASSLCRLDTTSAEQFAIAESYAFPPGYFCQSPQFIPRRGADNSQTNGYILCSVIYGNNSEMWLFDAQNLKAGPVCKLSHPQFKFAMTAHSTWLPEIAPRQSDYYIDVRQDYQPLVGKQPEVIQKLFEEYVYPNFPDSERSSDWPPVPATIIIANRTELTDLKLNVAQPLPSDLQGHFLMVAPVGSVASGGLPYPNGDNVFNGDGMIYRFDFDTPGEVKVTTRLAKPPCYYADLATQTQSEYAKYKFRNFGVERFSPHLGARNQLNTAFLPMLFHPDEPERLLLTYDGGRPFEIDTQTLETVTPVGKNSEWQPEAQQKVPFQAVMSTAHPCFDPYTQEMFSVNYGRSLSNFLATIPAIFWCEHLPPRLESLLDSVAEFLRQQRWFKKGLHQMFDWGKGIFKHTNIGITDFVHVIRWNGTDELERWQVLLPDGSPVRIEQSMHQTGMSRDYLILMDTAFKVGLEQILNNPIPESKILEKLLRELLTRPVNPDSFIYLVRRQDLKKGETTVIAKPVKIPLAAFHFLVDYDNPQGQITLHIGHPAGQDVSEWIRSYDICADDQTIPPYLQGFLTEATDVSRLGRYVIDGENGEIREAKVIYDTGLTWGLGFCGGSDRFNKIEQIYWQAVGFWHDLLPRFIYDLYENYPYRIVPSDQLLTMPNPGQNRLPCLLRLDTQSMTIADAYLFPQVSPDGKNWESKMLGSPQFMPRADGKGGYIICTVNTSNADEIWLFDADNLEKGPICQLSHQDLKFGTTLHTTWLSKIAPRQSDYYIDVRQDYEELVKKQPTPIQELFETQVYPHFKG